MTRRERVLAITVGVEAVLIMYGALGAFLTPSGSHEHDVLLAVVLLGIAAPLAWHAASAAFNLTRPADPLTLRVIIPNSALLVVCFNGLLESGPRPHGLRSALVASVALVIIAGATQLIRTRLPRDREPVRA